MVEPILVILDGIDTLVKLRQSENAPGLVITLAGMDMLVRV